MDRGAWRAKSQRITYDHSLTFSLITPYCPRFATVCNVYFLYQISLHHNTATRPLNVDKIISPRYQIGTNVIAVLHCLNLLFDIGIYS